MKLLVMGTAAVCAVVLVAVAPYLAVLLGAVAVILWMANEEDESEGEP